MKFDFDAVTDRHGTNCTKFDALATWFGKEGLLPLWIADMDFPVPPGVSEALVKRTAHPIYGYNSFPEGYFESFMAWQKKHHRWDVKKDWLCHTPGVLTALAAAILSFTEKGDGVLIQPPVYHPFKSTIETLGRRVVNNQLVYDKGRFTIDFDDLEKKAGEAKLFIFCSPHNPSGRVWTMDELAKVEALCRRKGLFVFSDEIHGDLIFHGHRHIPFASVSEWSEQNCVAAMAPSKTFNIAGLAMSMIAIPNEQKRACFQTLLRSGLHVGNGNSFGLVAAQAAYETGEEWYEELLVYLEGNIAFVEQELARRLHKITLVHPEATYIPLLDMKALGMDDAALRDFMINRAGVAMNSGDAFGPGGEGFMRLNVATQRRVLADFIDRLEKAVQSL